MAAARARRPTAAAYNVDGGAAGVTQRLACLEVLMGGAVSCPLHISSTRGLMLNQGVNWIRVEQQPVGCILLREGIC